MKTNIAINGFGRIGRLVFKKAFLEFDNIEIKAINDIGDVETLVHLLRYDSVHENFPKEIKIKDDSIVIGDKIIKVLKERNPENLPWGKMNIDVVVESTGLFRDREGASKHLKAGAKKVVISAPAKNPDKTVVMGVNHKELTDNDKIISNASCTTNCLAPIAKVLHESFGIKSGILNTIHSYTTTQNILDGPHKDLRRARAAAMSIIPTTTGAAIATTKVLPELKGKMDGLALRVPTPDGSIVDFTAVLEKDVTVDDVNKAMKNASKKELEGILEYSEEPLVSVDIVDNPHSSIFDAQSTMVIEKNTVKVLSWYDNEWGYSSRIVDLINYIENNL